MGSYKNENNIFYIYFQVIKKYKVSFPYNLYTFL